MLDAIPPPTLEVFYASTCAACRLDLPVLAQLARQDGTRLRIVILADEARARIEIRAALPTLDQQSVVASIKSPRETLRLAGDEDEILPFARTVRTNKTCASWRGRLSIARARALFAACKKLGAPPQPR